MPRVCTVCTHPDREAIDRALLAGEALRTLAARYGTLGRMALARHREHIPPTLAKAAEAEEIAHADDLLQQVRDLQARALRILDSAEKAGELRTALTAIGQARGNLELLAKLLGELDERPTVNVLLSPEWVQIRTTLTRALAPYPEARVAAAAALLELDGAHNNS